MAEIQAIPEPLERPDFDTLGDQQYDREVEASLWDQPIKRECGFCLGGIVLMPKREFAKCGCCNGKGYVWTHA